MINESHIDDLPPPICLIEQYPLHSFFKDCIASYQKTIEAILKGLDNRILLLVGPCSIHDPLATIEYAHRFKKLAAAVSDRFFCVMRCYVEKPRTTLGWKGFLYDPYLDGSYNIAAGIKKTRSLFSELAKLEIPLASEILELTTVHYFADFLSWACIGARTSASPPHRQIASSLACPVGFKNTIDGSIETAIHGMVAASQPHIFMHTNLLGQLARYQSTGNDCCHLVLRGSNERPNYFPDDIAKCTHLANEHNLVSRLVIDCSHQNSLKKPANQMRIFESVIAQIKHGNTAIAGLMLESFLEEGSQSIQPPLRYGVSITDPCLSWLMTEKLIERAYRALTPKVHSCCLC